MRCPNCKSLNIIKRGRREIKFGSKQLYQCKDCRLRFSDGRMVSKTYSAKVIIKAISCYNLGHSLESAARAVNRRFRKEVSRSSVRNWINETLAVCTYGKLRGKIDKDYKRDLLAGRTFAHGENKYEFKYHRAKLDYLCSGAFASLGQYIKRFEQDGCPDFFESIPYRCSQTAVKARVRKKNWRNNACSLAELALLPCTNNRQRHPLVQEFMLINDSSSIAVELPVWLYERGLRKRMSGHIDVLQVRGGKVYVLDYKPDAEKENEDKVVSQLYWYATGLSFRSKLPLRFFRCAGFDDDIYFEFDPNAVRVVK